MLVALAVPKASELFQKDVISKGQSETSKESQTSPALHISS